MPEMLERVEEIAPELWGVEAMQNVFGMRVKTRMTVVRLSDGSLLLHSPIAPKSSLQQELAALGPVHHLIAPNCFHHLNVPAALEAFPEARLYGAPGLAEKRKDLAFDGVLEAIPAPAWQSDLDSLWVRGAPLMNEVLFFHRSTRTLICTDLAFQVCDESSWFARTYFRLNGIYENFGVSRLVRLLFRDRKTGRECIDRVLDWDFERIVMAHGNVLTTGAKDAFREIYAWM